MSSPHPLLTQFYGLLNKAIGDKDGPRLQSILQLEPPFNDDYHRLLEETFSFFTDDDSLKESIASNIDVIASDDRDAWHAFRGFLLEYLKFIHSVDLSNLLVTYDKLTTLLKRAETALANDPHGILLVPTILNYSNILTRLAIGLDNRPDLTAHLPQSESNNKRLPEKAAGSIRTIIAICIREKGKSAVMYKLLNLCMKMLVQCGTYSIMDDLLAIVAGQNRPLSSFSRSDRVTFHFFLGRYFFATASFLNAVLALERAYAECHVAARKNRRLILVHLVTASIILGRFPTNALYDRPEALGFRERFEPLTTALIRGDIASFRRLTADSDGNPHRDWFVHFKILYQLKLACEPILWRSLMRRVFVIRNPASVGTSGTSKVAAQLDLSDVLVAARWQTRLSLLPPIPRPGERHTNWIFATDAPLPETYVHPEFAGTELADDDVNDQLPTLEEIEGEVQGLVMMGLMNGYIAFQSKRFAIRGTREKAGEGYGHPAAAAGWPIVWKAMEATHREKEVVGLEKGFG